MQTAQGATGGQFHRNTEADDAGRVSQKRGWGRGWDPVEAGTL